MNNKKDKKGLGKGLHSILPNEDKFWNTKHNEVYHIKFNPSKMKKWHKTYKERTSQVDTHLSKLINKLKSDLVINVSVIDITKAFRMSPKTKLKFLNALTEYIGTYTDKKVTSLYYNFENIELIAFSDKCNYQEAIISKYNTTTIAITGEVKVIDINYDAVKQIGVLLSQKKQIDYVNQEDLEYEKTQNKKLVEDLNSCKKELQMLRDSNAILNKSIVNLEAQQEKQREQPDSVENIRLKGVVEKQDRVLEELDAKLRHSESIIINSEKEINKYRETNQILTTKVDSLDKALKDKSEKERTPDKNNQAIPVVSTTQSKNEILIKVQL